MQDLNPGFPAKKNAMVNFQREIGKGERLEFGKNWQKLTRNRRQGMILLY